MIEYNYSKISANQLIPENIFLHDLSKESLKQVEIDPIDFCNHNCSWCFTKNFREDKKIDLISLKKYLDQFINNNGKSIVFSGGGEPLLYKELYNKNEVFERKSILKYLIDRNVHIGIITNGSLLHKLFNRDFKIKQISFIRVSLDSYNKSQHQKRHLSTDFMSIEQNIKDIVSKRKSNFTPAIGISIICNQTMNSSLKDIEKINKISCKLQLDFVQLKHIHTKGKKEANILMKKIHSYCLRMKWDKTEFWVQEYNSSNNTHSICRITKYIQAIGGIKKKYPCCHLFGREEYYGTDDFLAEGKEINGCDNLVCRYNEMNSILDGTDIKKSELILKNNITRFGFHPYRYCPTSPKILKPFSN